MASLRQRKNPAGGTSWNALHAKARDAGRDRATSFWNENDPPQRAPFCAPARLYRTCRPL